MVLHGAELRKALVAHRTNVRLLTGVGSHVLAHVFGEGKRSIAHVADVRTFAHVHRSDVTLQRPVELEAHRAEHAGI